MVTLLESRCLPYFIFISSLICHGNPDYDDTHSVLKISPKLGWNKIIILEKAADIVASSQDALKIQAFLGLSRDGVCVDNKGSLFFCAGLHN